MSAVRSGLGCALETSMMPTNKLILGKTLAAVGDRSVLVAIDAVAPRPVVSFAARQALSQ